MLGDITVVAQSAPTIRSLAENELIRKAFPGHTFKAYPDYQANPTARDPELYKSLLAQLKPRQIVIVALPDQLHYDAVMAALRHNQHLLVVKPLVLSSAQALEIEAEARKRNLVVGVEYHKRLDDRSLLARRRYRAGMFARIQARHRPPHGKVVLPPLQFPKLVHRRKFRRLHLHRLPLR
ncbi:MAG: Gfo/Idh/MocA family oxidoreductase [Bryobacterales bacterium]|nr:Gfo/Idh/MocA family oxidoreductase [Bryobacterales bacterium]